MGPDSPRPGRSTDQAMLSVIAVGTSLSTAAPEVAGPRNCGQSAPDWKRTAARERKMKVNRCIGRFFPDIVSPAGAEVGSQGRHPLERTNQNGKAPKG